MRHPLRVWRWDVVSTERLHELATAPLPGGRRSPPAVRVLYRDVHLDTPDRSLRRRSVTCRLRLGADDRRELILEIEQPDGSVTPVRARVRSLDALQAIAEHNTVTRRLAGIVDPRQLLPTLELEVERLTRVAARDLFWRAPTLLHHDVATVRRNGAERRFRQLTLESRHPVDASVAELAAALSRELGVRSADSEVARAEMLLKWMPATAATNGRHPGILAPLAPSGEPTDAAVLHPELSFLESQRRVLAMAEDAAVPLAERLRFVAIVAANLDEFFMVRVAGLRIEALEQAEECTGEWGDVHAQLRTIRGAARALQSRHHDAAMACLDALARLGTRVLAWDDLTSSQQESLRRYYRESIHPELTPLAMTMSSGHPFPRAPHLSLALAVIVRDRMAQTTHFAQVEIPPELPRVLPVESRGAECVVIPMEEVIRANLEQLYPGMHVEHAHPFRVTRSSLLTVDDGEAASLLDAVDVATRESATRAVVRVEVDPEMPPMVRDLVVDALRHEPGAASLPLESADVFELGGPVRDLRSVDDLPLPDLPELRYPSFEPRLTVPADASIFDAIRQNDLLVHHPFESFAGSVVRLVQEAADDPDVAVIRMTLYRTGEHSPIVEALRAAARRGKQVFAFVELRARFDEATNVKWVRALEKSGVRVVYGLRGLKTHAKAALIVRREGGRLRQYVHVGTGNYNARTGLAYTDLSLFSSDEGLAADLTDLFNSLAGSSAPIDRLAHGMLVAPATMVHALLDAIEREAALARGGLPGAITIKVNGLSDPEVARALTRAAADGVSVDLIVRGICTLRPVDSSGPGRLRVVSTTGRFLEHSRIYRFQNAGDPRYFIGSADLRPRNLRRRVELLAPVKSAGGRALLDQLLAAYLADPSGWELQPDGQYVQRRGEAAGVQDALLAGVVPQVEPNAKRQHSLNALAR